VVVPATVVVVVGCGSVVVGGGSVVVGGGGAGAVVVVKVCVGMRTVVVFAVVVSVVVWCDCLWHWPSCLRASRHVRANW
jgi:hypothetical protein